MVDDPEKRRRVQALSSDLCTCSEVETGTLEIESPDPPVYDHVLEAPVPELYDRPPIEPTAERISVFDEDSDLIDRSALEDMVDEEGYLIPENKCEDKDKDSPNDNRSDGYNEDDPEEEFEMYRAEATPDEMRGFMRTGSCKNMTAEKSNSFATLYLQTYELSESQSARIWRRVSHSIQGRSDPDDVGDTIDFYVELSDASSEQARDMLRPRYKQRMRRDNQKSYARDYLLCCIMEPDKEDEAWTAIKADIEARDIHACLHQETVAEIVEKIAPTYTSKKEKKKQ